MNHHLEHALKNSSISLKYYSNMKWIEVQDKIRKTLEDKELMKKWEDVFSYCENYKIDSYSTPALISCHPVNNTMQLGKNSYVMETNQGILLDVNGLSSPSRELVPNPFNDHLVLGAYLSGVHNKSEDAGKETFDYLRNYEKAKLGEKFQWFIKDALTISDNKYSQEDIVKKNFWENKWLIEDLKKFYKEIEYQNSFKIWSNDPEQKDIKELNNDIQNFVKKYSYVRKSEITPYPTFNIEYNLETDLFKNPELLSIKDKISSISETFQSRFDLNFAKENEKKVDAIKDKKYSKANKIKP